MSFSDQTSCHNAYNGGYCPIGLTFERTRLLHDDRATFRQLVDASLTGGTLTRYARWLPAGRFFDYGNSFLKAVFDAGVNEVFEKRHGREDGFIFPSYVEDIMGPLLFDYGLARSAGFASAENTRTS
ncbi:MAG: hypothetical protein R2912_08905 [Eubacteriales bacterium]